MPGRLPTTEPADPPVPVTIPLPFRACYVTHHTLVAGNVWLVGQGGQGGRYFGPVCQVYLAARLVLCQVTNGHN